MRRSMTLLLRALLITTLVESIALPQHALAAGSAQVTTDVTAATPVAQDPLSFLDVVTALHSFRVALPAHPQLEDRAEPRESSPEVERAFRVTRVLGRKRPRLFRKVISGRPSLSLSKYQGDLYRSLSRAEEGTQHAAGDDAIGLRTPDHDPFGGRRSRPASSGR